MVPMIPSFFMVWAVIRMSKIIRLHKKPFFAFLYPVFLTVIYALMLIWLILGSPDGLVAMIVEIPLAVGAFFAFVTAVLVAIVKRKAFGKAVWLYILAAVLFVPGSLPAAHSISDAASQRCNDWHVQTGAVLVKGIERYYSAEKVYPFRLTDLVPGYVDPASLSTCYNRFNVLTREPIPEWGGYAYKNCSPGAVQISIPLMGYTGEFSVYDFGEKAWSISHIRFNEDERKVLECNPVFSEHRGYD